MDRIKRLKELVEEKARQYGEFTLSSGLKSNHYFDLKKLLSNPEGIALVGEAMFDLVVAAKAEAVGGYGIGGEAIVGAIVVTSHLKGKPIPGFCVIDKSRLRGDDPQKHEEQDYVIKGHLPGPGGKVAIIDDVLSTGRAILIATRAVEAQECQVVKIAVLLDRQLGGSERLRKVGYYFTALLRTNTSGNIYIN